MSHCCRLILPISSDLFPNVLTSPLSFLSFLSFLSSFPFLPSADSESLFFCLFGLPYITRPGALFFFPDIRSFLFTGRSIAFQEKLGVARLLVDFFPLSLFFGVRFLGSKKASKHSLNQHSFESNLTLLRFGSKLEFFSLPGW